MCVCMHTCLGQRQMSSAFLCLSQPCYLPGSLLLNLAIQIQLGQLSRELSSSDLSVLEINEAVPCLFTSVLGNMSACLRHGHFLELVLLLLF